jgi:hypothetical protein
MAMTDAHMPLCAIELIAEGRAERCPGQACAFWDHGCVLARVEAEFQGRPELAALLLSLRRELDKAAHASEDASSRDFHRRLAGCE